MAHTCIEVPLFDYPLILCTSKRELARALQGKYPDLLNTMEARVAADALGPIGLSTGWFNELTTGEGDVICGVICVDSRKDVNTVAHESTHAAMAILDFSHVEIAPDNHEVLAYLVGYIAEKITENWK